MNNSKYKSKFNNFKVNPRKEKRNKEKEEIHNLNQLKKAIGDLKPAEIDNFSLLPLSDKTQKGLKLNGFIEPTKVQRETLIHSLQGLDVVVAAKTGSGKTIAFIIPILELLNSKMWNFLDGLGVLVITPTRELAYQIYEVFNKVGKQHSFSVGLIIGGKDLRFEWSRIKGCNIIICTPGRLLQHMSENPEFNCDNLQMLVLDEADQCLSMGFADTMNMILQELPQDRQTLLFSATQTRDVKDLVRAGCKNPIYCSIHEHSKTATPKSLKESYLVCEDSMKVTFLWSFLKHHKNKKLLVFLATCKQVKFMYDLFTHLRPGLTVMCLHGGMHQLRRMAVYDEFCRMKRSMLFATDVAARGLDIPAVDWVIQMDCPEDVTTYIHRVGRTARHAKSGDGLLILTPSQEDSMVESLKQKNIFIDKIDVDPNKLQSIQLKVELMLSKYLSLKEEAERAFKAYLKNIAYMKNKKVFNFTTIKLDALARSFGMTVTPRVRFLERHLKNKAAKSDKTEEKISTCLNSKTEDLKTYKLGITEDESDDEFLSRLESQPAQFEENPEDILKDYSLFTKSNKEYMTKFGIARKIVKNNVKVNARIVFDDDEGDLTSEEAKEEPKEPTSGINISEMQEYLKTQDILDKQTNSLRLKEQNRKEKRKLKELKRQEREQTKGIEEEEKDEEEESYENEEVEDEEYFDDEEDYESDIDPATMEIIDDLPDPDKVYADKSSQSSSSDSESDTENESPRENKEKRLKRKRDFRGKREAKEAVRSAKKARLIAENDLEAISFTEKEDLALFLLKNSTR